MGKQETLDFHKEFKRRKNEYLKFVTEDNSFIKAALNPLCLGVSDPGNIPGGVLRTHSYLLAFQAFCMPPSVNVDPHID